MDQELQVDPVRDLREGQETLRKFRNLVQSEGWVELRRIAEAQAQMREGPVLRSAHTPEHELWKGEALGIRSILALPATIVSEIESQLEVLTEKAENVDPE